MRVHSDIACLRPASEDVRWAFTPRTFELPFSHQVALFVSLCQIQIFARQQEHMNYVFIE